jgi:hypothetical protein
MYTVLFLCGLLAFSIVPTAGGSDGEPERILKPGDFAFGSPVDGKGAAPFQELVLPLEFYQGVTRPDLQDCAVFDGAGRPVPHAVRAPARPVISRSTESLPFFPVFGYRGREQGAISLNFKRAPDGTILELQSGAEGRPGDSPVAYILDASVLKDPFSALVLKFEPEGESRMMPVHLEGSLDLNEWISITRSQTVGQLVYQGRSIEKNRLEFKPCRYKYLRLTWEFEGGDPRLLESRVELSKQVVEDLHQWLSVRTRRRDDPQPTYHCDTRGVMAVDRLKLVFPGNNVAIPVKIYSRKNEQETWRIRSEALVHRLTIAGEVISGEEIHLTDAVPDRLWKVDPILRPGEGEAPGELELIVGWVPHRLVFLTQGEPPYTLAFGSGSRKSSSFPVQTLMEKVSPQSRNGVLVASAQLGSRFVLGGDDKLQPPTPPLPYKQWILWGVLLTGVVLMGWMAVKLYRQLGPPQPAVQRDKAPAGESADHKPQTGDQ